MGSCLSLLTTTVVVMMAAAAGAFPAFVAEDAKSVLTPWFAAHPNFRLLDDSDCRCDDDLKRTRTQTAGVWKPSPNYHPYYLTGDFNDDGQSDLAVGVAQATEAGQIRFLIINSFQAEDKSRPPAFLSETFAANTSLFWGAPRPRPYRLVAGPFESEGILFKPTQNGQYRVQP